MREPRPSPTPEQAARIAQKECPVCGIPRKDFQPRNRHAVCCCPDHSETFWRSRPTQTELRGLVYREQEGHCKSCNLLLILRDDIYVLDHIIPIAMGGDQVARENLQVLCSKCNKEKTARDMGRIAHYKRLRRLQSNNRQISLPEGEATHQATLF